MKTVYKCDKCGMVFDDYEQAMSHENHHFEPKTWYDSNDEEVVNREIEYEPVLNAPSAVVVPMTRSFMMKIPVNIRLRSAM